MAQSNVDTSTFLRGVCCHCCRVQCNFPLVTCLFIAPSLSQPYVRICVYVFIACSSILQQCTAYSLHSPPVRSTVGRPLWRRTQPVSHRAPQCRAGWAVDRGNGGAVGSGAHSCQYYGRAVCDVAAVVVCNTNQHSSTLCNYSLHLLVTSGGPLTCEGAWPSPVSAS